MRYVLPRSMLFVAVLVAIVLADSGSMLMAQTGQTVPPPPPLQLPPVASTSTACLVNCDTAAMNCLNSCVIVGPAAGSSLSGAIPNTVGSAACNNACSTTQLVCKQGCTR
jgi:hypothetical protein